MMKILALGLVYHFLLHSRAAGEEMVKVQMCSDVFENAIADSLNKIEQSELKDHIGDLQNGEEMERKGEWRGKGKKQSKDKELPITGVQLDFLPGIRISSNNFETTFTIKIKYGDKKYQQTGRRWTQNSFLFLDMDMVTTLQLNVNKDKVVYSLQQCDVYVRSRETNQNQNTNLELPKKKLCGIVRRVIGIMNENWKDYLIIDPLGDTKLRLKSTVPVNDNCIELNMNLVIGGSEVSSQQSHDALPGSGISLLIDYMNTMLSAGNYLSELNKKLASKRQLHHSSSTQGEMYPELTPEELQKLFHDVHETDPTRLAITIKETPKLKATGEDQVVTFKAKLQGYALKSDDPVFEVLFETNMKIKLEIKNNKLLLQFLSSGDPDILDWKSSIGHSGDFDLKNLQILIKKLNNEIILGALTDLHLSFGIPFWNLAFMVDFKKESVQISPKES